MYCIYLKKRKGKPYCKLIDKEINLSACYSCEHKEYKNNAQKSKNNVQICKKNAKNKKITKLERERKSILTDNLDICYVCGKEKNHLHEVYEGTKRLLSMKYNCVIPLCWECHYKIHNDRCFALIYKKECQLKIEENITREEFIKLFGRNYL